MNSAFADADWIINPANSHQYKAIGCGSWTLCDVVAQQQQGHLVTISDAGGSAWLLEQFGDNTNYWIVLSDAATEGT